MPGPSRGYSILLPLAPSVLQLTSIDVNLHFKLTFKEHLFSCLIIALLPNRHQVILIIRRSSEEVKIGRMETAPNNRPRPRE